MLKLFKIPVTGITDSDVLGVNLKYRTTMGYDDATSSISVLVESVDLPNVGEVAVDLRQPATTATFTEVAKRVFTVSDFSTNFENMKWVVEFNPETNTITDPIDVYALSASIIVDNKSARKIPEFLSKRWDNTLVPLFALDSIYKNVVGFHASVLSFYEFSVGNELVDTIITNLDVEVATPKAKEQWVSFHVSTHVSFEILNDQGEIMASILPTVKPEAKATPFYEVSALNVDPGSLSRITGGNQYKVSMPVQSTYNIRIIYGRDLGELIDDGNSIIQVFDVSCINGITNKSRTVSGDFNDRLVEFTATLATQHTQRSDGSSPNRSVIAGLDNLIIQTFGLLPGDYVKLKLDLGQFKSYAELWIDLV